MDEQTNWKSSKEIKQLIITGVFIVIIALILLPLIIELINSNYINAGDVLSFWGAIIGAIIGASVAIMGVFLTLRDNQKIVKQERKLNVLPLISINKIITKKKNINFRELIEDDTAVFNIEEEYIGTIEEELNDAQNDKLLIYFTNGKVLFNHVLTKEQENLILYGGFKKGNSQDGIMFIDGINYFYSSYYFINSGIGTAVNFKITFVESNNDYPILVSSIPVNLLPAQKYRVTFFSDDIENINKLRTIKLEYKDIYMNEYYQTHDFLIIDKNDLKNELIFFQEIKQTQI